MIIGMLQNACVDVYTTKHIAQFSCELLDELNAELLFGSGAAPTVAGPESGD